MSEGYREGEGSVRTEHWGKFIRATEIGEMRFRHVNSRYSTLMSGSCQAPSAHLDGHGVLDGVSALCTL